VKQYQRKRDKNDKWRNCRQRYNVLRIHRSKEPEKGMGPKMSGQQC